jgi:hypothetical protein
VDFTDKPPGAARPSTHPAQSGITKQEIEMTYLTPNQQLLFDNLSGLVHKTGGQDRFSIDISLFDKLTGSEILSDAVDIWDCLIPLFGETSIASTKSGDVVEYMDLCSESLDLFKIPLDKDVPHSIQDTNRILTLLVLAKMCHLAEIEVPQNYNRPGITDFYSSRGNLISNLIHDPYRFVKNTDTDIEFIMAIFKRAYINPSYTQPFGTSLPVYLLSNGIIKSVTYIGYERHGTCVLLGKPIFCVQMGGRNR